MNYFFFPETKKETEKRAKELVDYLNKAFKTTHWKPKAWFNTWWCYSASCGSVCVCACELGKGHIDDGKPSMYHTLISDVKREAFGGASMWTKENKHIKPDESVRIAMNHALKATRQIKETMEDNILLLALDEKI